MSQSVTRSPIELFSTAKKKKLSWSISLVVIWWIADFERYAWHCKAVRLNYSFFFSIFSKTSLNLGSEIEWQLDRSGLSICPHPPLTDLTIWAQWSMAMTGTFRELIWHWKMEDIQVIKKLSAKPVETGIWSRSDWMVAIWQVRVWGARVPNLYFGSIQYSWGTWLGSEVPDCQDRLKFSDWTEKHFAAVNLSAKTQTRKVSRIRLSLPF